MGLHHKRFSVITMSLYSLQFFWYTGVIICTDTRGSCQVNVKWVWRQWLLVNNPMLPYTLPMWCYDPYISIIFAARSSQALASFLLTHSLTCEIAGQVKPFPQPLTCCVDSASSLNELVNTMVTSLITCWLSAHVLIGFTDCPKQRKWLSCW